MIATFIIARLTFLEAIRRRILLAALVLGIAFLIVYGIGVHLMETDAAPARNPQSPQNTLILSGMRNFLLLAGLYAVDFLALAMGALASADTLAGEIGSGTIQAIVTKPVRRAQIVLGKWLGFASLLALYLVLMAGGVMAIMYFRAGYVAPNLWAGILLVYLTALIVMTITLMCSSMFSTLATGGIVFGLYGLAFIGGWVEQFGAVLNNRGAINIGVISSLIFPSEALWRRAAFEMTPPVAQALGFSFSGPMATISAPSELMVGYAIGYLVAALAIAVRMFAKRDL
jgi:ABC-type transport system involved in multi-copper enzyme maturation permease subunit